jgi:hypothetical protein
LKIYHFFKWKMSEKQTTFFTVNCAGKFESANQCSWKNLQSSLNTISNQFSLALVWLQQGILTMTPCLFYDSGCLFFWCFCIYVTENSEAANFILAALDPGQHNIGSSDSCTASQVNGGCIQWSALWVMSCEAESRNQRKLVTTSRIKFSLSPSKMCICTGVSKIVRIAFGLRRGHFSQLNSMCMLVEWSNDALFTTFRYSKHNQNKFCLWMKVSGRQAVGHK